MSKPDSGPAFPTSENEFSFGSDGMTLRDYFAGQALAALIAIGQSLGSINPEELAHDGYRFADAMIAERAKS